MSDESVREHVLYLLQGGGAHLDFEQAIAGLPEHLRGAKVANVPHTPWRLLEHMRICQWDILEFSRDPDHVSPVFPEGYWPERDAPPDAGAWDRTVAAFRADLQAMMDFVAAPATDLYAPIPHGNRQTIFREALLVADHNAYHLGQLVILRRCLGAWHEERCRTFRDWGRRSSVALAADEVDRAHETRQDADVFHESQLSAAPTIAPTPPEEARAPETIGHGGPGQD